VSRVGELSVDITADASRLRRELAGITGAGGPLAALPKVAAAAALAAGAAIAGVGARSLAVFGDFDTAMREVFTLLPNISQDAMDDMSAQVLAFSREFGKLPNEVIPALYQALSAGVPADNVFAFLETANALAVGGVADLQAATDVLTGSVNAYGEEMLTYGEASDALFTAVRLGVTTIPELAAAIGRVTPVSADLGISFDTVAALLATLTTVFPSTAESATGLRTMLAELGRQGSIASEAFERATGETFPAFIAGGGTMEEALASLGQYAEDNDLRMNDLFGSIEAGMAASVLAGDEGSAQLGVAMDAMGEKSGATQAAFEQMDEGIQASWNRLTAGFNTLMVEVGNELAPMFQGAVDTIVTDIMPTLSAVVIGIFQGIAAATTWLKEQWDRFQTDTDGIYASVRGIVEAAGTAIEAVFNALVAIWENVLKPAWEAIAPLVEVLWSGITTTIENNLAIITGVLNALAALLNGDFKSAWEAIETAITTVTDNTKALVETAWNGIKAFLDERFGAIKQAAEDRWNEMTATVESVTNALSAWLQSTWETIKAWLEGLWGDVGASATAAWELIRGNIEAPVVALRTWLEETWETIRGWLEDKWNHVATTATVTWVGVKEKIQTVTNGLKAWIEERWESIKAWLEATWDAVATVAGAKWESVKAAVLAPIEAVITALEDLWNGFKTWFGNHTRDIATAASTAWAEVADAIGGAFGGLGGIIQGVFDGVVDTIRDAINAAIGAANNLIESWNGITFQIPEIRIPRVTIPNPLGDDWVIGGQTLGGSSVSVPQIPTIPTIPALASGGVVTGPMRALIGEAGPEAVIPLDRLDRMIHGMMGYGGGNQTIIVELDGQVLTRAVAPRFVDQLRLRTGTVGL
jgi:TP901 family phage tail tape measure protein